MEITYVEKKRVYKSRDIVREMEATNLVCQKFIRWLTEAPQGDRFCYHKGDWLEGQLVGKTAYRAYKAGKVSLFQQREPKGFSYWAQRRSEN